MPSRSMTGTMRTPPSLRVIPFAACPKKVEIGMRVKAVWKPEGERDGSVTDLMYFRPVKIVICQTNHVVCSTPYHLFSIWAEIGPAPPRWGSFVPIYKKIVLSPTP